MSVQLEHVLLSALTGGTELVLSFRREGEGMRLHAELVARASDRMGLRTGESRHTLVEKTGPNMQVLDDMSRFVSANLADAMLREP